MLNNGIVKLRAVEPEDVDFLFNTENEPRFWKVSETSVPFSRNTLKKYSESIHDIYKQRQFRFIIELIENRKLIGILDLFDFSPKNRRVAIGIIISDLSERNKGYAKASLELIEEYCVRVLNLNQLSCSIQEDNVSSIELFQSLNYVKYGIRQEWYISDKGEFIAECLFQKKLTY